MQHLRQHPDSHKNRAGDYQSQHDLAFHIVYVCQGWFVGNGSDAINEEGKVD
jgi:hypothetical protein